MKFILFLLILTGLICNQANEVFAIKCFSCPACISHLYHSNKSFEFGDNYSWNSLKENNDKELFKDYLVDCDGYCIV